MILRRVWVLIAVVCLCAWASAVSAGSPEDAAKAFAEGDALLAQSDFKSALRAFGEAARQDPANVAYRERFMTLRRVIKMRDALAKEREAEKWADTADALRAFYVDCGLHGEALALDRQYHERAQSSESAVRLAESQLAMAKNAEAAEQLGELGERERTPRARALLGIALARQGKLDEAKAIAGDLPAADDADPVLLRHEARLLALTGDSDKALQLLTLSFERTPPSRLDATKAEVKTCKDFAGLLEETRFAAALQTASKIAESDCSGGTSCGKCPSRASCSGNTQASSSEKKTP